MTTKKQFKQSLPPALRLTDLIKRRKSTLKKTLVDLGVSTYEGTLNMCSRMGVIPPTEHEFNAALGITVSSNVNDPQDGIVVVDELETIIPSSDELFSEDVPTFDERLMTQPRRRKTRMT